MEAVIFVGIQAAGKSTFYRERFFRTHLRLSLDMLKTRRREQILLSACLSAGQRFVIDNTNPTRESRANHISLARDAGFRVVGYYFETTPSDVIKRNRLRTGKQQVPVQAIYGTFKKLEPPSFDEGFDELFVVTIDAGGQFVIREGDSNSTS